MPVNLINLANRKIKEEYRIDVDKNSSNNVFKIKTKNGWRAVDSPYDPVEEARSATTGKKPDNTSLLVIGAGSGYIASELINSTLNDITLVTGSNVLGERNIEIFTKYKSKERNINVIVAESADDSLFRLIHLLTDIKDEFQIIYHSREIKAFPCLFNPLLVFIQSLLFPARRRAVKPPKRVLFPNAEMLLEPEIYKELKARGVEVILSESFSTRKISPFEAWETLRKYAPDLVFSVNNKGSDPGGMIPDACALAGIPWVTWFYDEPRFIVSEAETGRTQSRFGFCWDIAGIDACTQLGFSKVQLLPLATDPSIFTPGKGLDDLAGRVVFVGSPSFGSEERYFSSIKKNHDAHLIANTIEKNITEKRVLPSYQEILNVMNELCIEKDRFSYNTFRRLPAFVLYIANLRYRIHALSALADLKPVVYGEGWHGLLPDSVELRSYVDYNKDLVHIYRSDAVHLSLTHLQMRLYPNQRVFDVGACGRIVLGDKLAGWNDLFGSEFDDLIFDGFDELHEKAASLAEKPEKRRRLGSELRKLILKKHTIANRIDTIFDAVAGT